MMIRRCSPSRVVALDLMLRTFMNSSDFNNMQNKNWEAIAKLIPGTTPQECAKRFQELQSAAGDLTPVGDFTGFAARGEPAPRGHASSGSGKLQQSLVTSTDGEEGEDKQKNRVDHQLGDDDQSSQPSKKTTQLESGQKKLPPESYGPNMVIHVCDEAKSVKKDFTCPRDLLVSEMRYFAEYLSSSTQHWEEVDISVHCDVQIFDWLMNYVKRNCSGAQLRMLPNLEPSNVISILISSDFLKMDSLVQECVAYCHNNMSAIVATPCNMNCINDKLCTRIADLFTDLEVDNIKDRKDKFKGKLFCKKIETLFSSQTTASTLYRCEHCKRLLTSNLHSKMKCVLARINIDRAGNVVYSHQRDPTWDINDYLIGLRAELKSWRDVYWRLWATITYLTCSRCKRVFPCSEVGHCRFHPEPAKFDTTSAIGEYGCCQQKTLRFDPLDRNTGCQVRDHIVVLPAFDEQPLEKPSQSYTSDPSKVTRRDDSKILDILLKRKDVMSVPPKSPEQERWHDIDVFRSEESLCGLADEGIGVKAHLQLIFPDDHLPAVSQPDHGSRSRDATAVMTSDLDSPSDDEIGDEEVNMKGSKHHHRRLIRKMSSKSSVVKEKSGQLTANDSAASSLGYRRTKWDLHQSLRFNQDAQREEDLKRNQYMLTHLSKMRTDTTPERADKTRGKEYAGGLFSRLEVQFRNSCQISKPTTQISLQRAKTKANQLRTT